MYLMIVLVPLYYLTPFSVVIDYLFVVVRRLFVWFARNPGVLLVLSIVLILGVWFIVALREQLNRVVLFVGWESLLYVRLRRQQVVLDEEAFWKRISTLKEYDVIRMVEQRVKNSAAAERLESYRKALCYVNNDWAQTYLFKKIDQVHREQRHKEMNAG